MLPQAQTMSLSTTPSGYIRGDDFPVLGSKTKELGPYTLYTANTEDFARMWVAAVEGLNIVIYPEDSLFAKIVFTTAPSTPRNVGLAFNQNGFPFVSYEFGTTARMHWYDPTVSSYVNLDITDAFTPMLTMDDKRYMSTLFNINDVLLFYCKGENIYYRQQRERFQNEYAVVTGINPTPPAEPTKQLNRLGMSISGRLQLQLRDI